jgi:CDP-4-dehydro-6-deoxyglucose reductase, E3
MAEKTARITGVETLAHEVLLFRAEMVEPAELRYRAGQFLSIRIDATGNVRRSYSIASAPDRPDAFELLVKVVPGGAGSELFLGLAPGDEIHFTGPMGFFVCDLAHAGDAVFAVTGSGIAAALPMIEEALARPAELERGRVLLYWGLRSEEDLYWQDRLAALAAASPRFAYHVCLSRPGPTWTGVNGRITRHVLDALPNLDRPVFYVVGNGSMIRDLKKELMDRGVDRKRQIRVEVFYPASEPVTPPRA